MGIVGYNNLDEGGVEPCGIEAEKIRNLPLSEVCLEYPK
jgi:hypothetical protein